MIKRIIYLIKLKNNAARAPNIAGLAPAQLQYHFRRPVVSGGDYAGVVLPVESGRPKVDEFDPRVAHPAHRALAGRTGLGVPVRRHEQNVFRLEIRVREVVVVQELETNVYKGENRYSLQRFQRK